ncbi:bifunctional folylpolyglutamate synthase/dihydrofolate synthase [Facklamia miroungae]|nr:bifunctional folylpolyglutamate synthase/dihydrofolate synthase [Facklamia miroungae]
MNSLTDNLPSILYGEGDRLAILKALLKQLGHPDQTMKIIHVAGTNGKGSTGTMIAHLLLGHGYRTGIFTSPHLYTECESIRVNDQMINQEEFNRVMIEVHQAAVILGLNPETDLSQFETTFLIAMVYYAHLACDYLVLECGVGGALDATNAISHSDYAIFTKIGMDHLNLLGDSLQAIVETKAGIMRPNQQVVVAPHQKDGVLSFLKTKANAMGSKLFDSSDQVVHFVRPYYYQVELSTKMYQLYLPLLGRFQTENLKTVMKWYQVWLSVEDEKVEKVNLASVFKKIKMTGRFEQVQSDPTVILDAAHNLDAIEEFVASIQASYPNQALNILCGFLKDKDVASILDRLITLPANFYVTQPDFPERAMASEELAVMFEERGVTPTICPDSRSCLIDLMEDSTRPVLVVGSFHLIKKVRDLFDD